MSISKQTYAELHESYLFNRTSILFDVMQAFSLLEIIGLATALYFSVRLGFLLIDLIGSFFDAGPRKVEVGMFEGELSDKLLPKKELFDPSKLINEQNTVYLWDPSTMDYFGSVPAMRKDEVDAVVAKAKIAQAKWRNSSFKQRRLLMRTMLRYITENQEACARVAVRDSGKTFLDALIGEVLVTCEKLVWLAENGERYLQVSTAQPL